MKFIMTLSCMFLISSLYSQVLEDDTAYIENGRNIKLVERIYARDTMILKFYINGKPSLTDTLFNLGVSYWRNIFDFDGDGNKDIMITTYSNNPFSTLYQFDSYTSTFIKVNNFEDFPEALPLSTNLHLFYSYHRSGCADADWDSDLFMIKNHKAISIENIHADDCFDEKHTIAISKISKNEKKLFETLPISTLGGFKNYKWGFIADYWGKNFSKFTQK